MKIQIKKLQSVIQLSFIKKVASFLRERGAEFSCVLHQRNLQSERAQKYACRNSEVFFWSHDWFYISLEKVTAKHKCNLLKY